MVVVAVTAWAAVAVAAAAPVAAQTAGFDDVAEDAYYSVPVAALAERGVFVGTECAEGFCPDDPIDRKTMAVWLVRALDGTDPSAVSESRFDDVDTDSLHAPFIERMAELGVTRGCGDGSGFCPDDVVSRGQMAVFLASAYGLLPGPDPGFSDVGDEWYAAAVASLVASGITTGCGDGTMFCPQGDTGRAHMATFMHRAHGRADQPSNGPPERLRLHRFYEKYVDAGGLPVVSSASVPDAALYRARDIITEMLPDGSSLLAEMARRRVRVAIMARSSVASDLPELSNDRSHDDRTKGGGMYYRPVVVVSEENLLCYRDDIFPDESVLVHEFAHAVHLAGLAADDDFDWRLNSAYWRAMDAGLWENTYAGTRYEEYWAVGVQAWFDLSRPPGPIHNEIDTRAELKAYDHSLARLIEATFGDAKVSSSCHDTASPLRANSRIVGRVLGPNGNGVGGVGLWAWSGEWSTSGYSTTQPDGTFAVGVPNGSFTLNVHANTGEDCTFVGRYGPGGFTAVRESATPVVVDGASISGIEIMLPHAVHDLPFIEWCA